VVPASIADSNVFTVSGGLAYGLGNVHKDKRGKCG
jgi:hypothetical protein